MQDRDLRYPTPLSVGSLSHSECSTPPQSPLNIDTLSSCSQSQTSASTLPRIAINPTALGEWRKDRPYVEEPRHVKLQKGSEPLGISIVSGEKGGIYVSKVTGGSIAHQAGLEYGDQLLEVSGALPLHSICPSSSSFRKAMLPKSAAPAMSLSLLWVFPSSMA